MKHIPLLLLVMIPAVVCSQKLQLLGSNLVTEKANKLYAGKKVLDLGLIKGCGSNEKYFYIQNTGNKPLQVTRVESSIKGCGSISYPTSPVAPGATDSIRVERMTCCYTGTVWETLDVYTNEAGSNRLSAEKFIVKSTFDKPELKYTLSAKKIKINNATCDSTYSFIINNTGNRPFKISSMQSPDQNIFINFFLKYNIVDCGKSLNVKFKLTGATRTDASPTIEFELSACYDESNKIKDFVYVSYQR